VTPPREPSSHCRRIIDHSGAASTQLRINPGMYMTNTPLTSISVHVICAVDSGIGVIPLELRADLRRRICECAVARKQKIQAGTALSDPIHALAELNADEAVSDFIRGLKKDSAGWVNRISWITVKKFRWQKGFGIFSTDMRDRRRITRYIENQEAYHLKHTFREECAQLQRLAGMPSGAGPLFDFKTLPKQGTRPRSFTAASVANGAGIQMTLFKQGTAAWPV